MTLKTWQQRKDGRWVVRCRDQTPYLWYRVVMWNELGRELAPDELVHHINGDCTDDRLENLEIISGGHQAHVNLHRRQGDSYSFTDDDRRRAVQAVREKRAAKRYCARGHEWTPENTYRWGGKRQCRACRAANALRKRVELESVGP